MNNFFDRIHARKFALIKYIYDSPEHTATLEQLTFKFNLSTITLNRTIKDIKSDFIDFDFKQKVSISETNLMGSKAYKIILYSNFSLNHIQLTYMNNSIKFRLLNDLLLDNLGDINSTAAKYFITYSTLRRHLENLKADLDPFKIELRTKSKLTLIGDEITIRFFYTDLFFNIYEGLEWPFTFIDSNRLDKFLATFDDSIYPKNEYNYRLFFYYFISISLLRIRQKHLIDFEEHNIPLFKKDILPYNPKVFTPFQKTLEDSIAYIENYLPATSNQILENEVSYIYSIVISYGPYQNNRIPSFFYTNKFLKSIGFYESVLFFLDVLESHLPIKLTTAEYYTLQHTITLIHYRCLLINDFLLNVPDSWITDKSFLYALYPNQKFYLTEFVNHILDMSTLAFLKPYKHYLLPNYISASITSVNTNRFNPKIKLLIISKVGLAIEKYIISNSDLTSLFEIEFSENINESADLIVSDISLKQENFINLNSEIEIFLWSIPPSTEQWNELRTLIFKISKRKSLFPVSDYLLDQNF